jgi:hypothetical protein
MNDQIMGKSGTGVMKAKRVEGCHPPAPRRRPISRAKTTGLVQFRPGQH